MSRRGAPPIRRGFIPGGPDDPREALPEVVKCALCDDVIDDGKSNPPPDIMRCPNCGPVCLACVTSVPVEIDARGAITDVLRCGGCGEELKEGGA